MNDDLIGPDSRVTLHFSLRLADAGPSVDSDPEDALLDSTFGRKPASLVIGDGSLLPGFERRLFGLRAGDRERFHMLPEDGFGQPNPGNIQRVARSSFTAETEPMPGMVMSFTDASGSEVPGVISGFDGDQVVVDFNHPLAGRELLFEVEILAVDNTPDDQGEPIA